MSNSYHLSMNLSEKMTYSFVRAIYLSPLTTMSMFFALFYYLDLTFSFLFLLFLSFWIGNFCSGSKSKLIISSFFDYFDLFALKLYDLLVDCPNEYVLSNSLRFFFFNFYYFRLTWCWTETQHWDFCDKWLNCIYWLN